VLSLDAAALPTPANAPVRKAILDVTGDGVFDRADLEALLRSFVQGYVDAANHGAPVEPATRDYGRHDLNGDGFTGGSGRRPFDLDRVGSKRYGPPQLSSVQQTIAGTAATFDETALTDLQILCYYAHSGLWQGTAAERTALLDPPLCTAPVAFDWSKIRSGFFHLRVERAHVTVEHQGGPPTNEVRDDFIHMDQVPNFGTLPVPDPAVVAASPCMTGGRTAGSFATFDVPGSHFSGKRTEWSAGSNSFFYSAWSAAAFIPQGPIPPPTIQQLIIESCAATGSFVSARTEFLLHAMPGDFPGGPGYVRFRLTGADVCQALFQGTFLVQRFTGSVQNPLATTVTSFECGTDPAKNFLDLFLHAG
jgi:hypothetical protein